MARLPFGKDIPLSLTEFQSEMNNLFERLWHSGVTAGPLDGQDWAPPVDVLEEETQYVIRAEVPGLEAKDIELSVTGETVTLKGHKGDERREGDERSCLRLERRFGSFSRTIQLPVAVDPSSVTAACKRGVLEVVLAKKEEHRPKSIRVDVSD